MSKPSFAHAVQDLDAQSFEDSIRHGVVLVNFLEPWSGECRLLAPSLKGLAIWLKGRLKTADVSLDDHPELAQQFAITQVPTLVLFDHAAPVERFTGLMSSQELGVRLRGVLVDYAEPTVRGGPLRRCPPSGRQPGARLPTRCP